jgi:uncharacterized membrane protein
VKGDYTLYLIHTNWYEVIVMKEKDKKKIPSSGTYIAVGVAVGTALGVALDNIGLGIALGLAIGAAIDWSIKNKNNNQK